MSKKKRNPRWQRLLAAHRLAQNEGGSPWLSSLSQMRYLSRIGPGTTTISKIRSEARAAGWSWKTRKNEDGAVEYRPVRA